MPKIKEKENGFLFKSTVWLLFHDVHIFRGSQWEEETVATTGQKSNETIGEKTRSP